MAEKEEKETTSSNGDEVEEAWGTLEELLLACAVNRHGTNSWDSIAKELQRRMKHAFSPHNCKQKYVDLKRRFHAAAAAAATSGDCEERENDEEEDDDELLRMVDELRKLRVEELKREVQRHDLSIVSLQLKVKRLEEERERSFSKAEQPEAASDLRIEPDRNDTGNEGKNNEPERSSPDKVITGDSTEDRSFNESNSTNHNKAENKKDAAAALGEERESKSKRKLEEKGDSTNHEPDPVRSRIKTEPVKDGGSESDRVGNTTRASRPVELGESVCESKRDSGKQQQSSDVQSSASLSKKKRRRFRGLGSGGGGSSGDELEADEVSPANKRINVKSHPLIRFLETLQSHKHGSVFQRRLPSQETEKYRNVIRQHMDLDTVQSRLDKGIYRDCHPKFYRDILLIFTNAVLFYRKSSAEHIAARELRKLVIDEIALRTQKSNITQPVKPDPDPQHLEPVVKKPRSSTTMVVCRRRSSSSMQALSESMKKKDDSSHATSKNINKNDNFSSNSRVENDHHQKKVDGSNTSNALASRKEKDIEKGGGGGSGGGATNAKKLLTKERSSLGRGGLRLSNNNSKKIISKEGNNREKLGKSNSSNKKEESSEGEGAEMVEMRKKMNADQKQEKGTTTTLKKQGVANFLKRMKQNSPSSQEKLKNNESEKAKEEEEKVGRETREKTTNNGKKRGGNPKRNNGDGDGNRNGNENIEAVATRGNAGRREERELAASRKVIGRPPKRKASMMSSTPDSGKGGRSNGRDSGEKSKKKPRR